MIPRINEAIVATAPINIAIHHGFQDNWGSTNFIISPKKINCTTYAGNEARANTLVT